MQHHIYVKGKMVAANPEPVKLTCRRCGYSWLYRGYKEFFATCPNCLRKVKIVR